MEPGSVIESDSGANGDAQLAFSIESEISETTGVGTSGHGFQCIDNFHSPDLGRTGDASAGETRFEDL
jgi:hypothetical protein